MTWLKGGIVGTTIGIVVALGLIVLQQFDPATNDLTGILGVFLVFLSAPAVLSGALVEDWGFSAPSSLIFLLGNALFYFAAGALLGRVFEVKGLGLYASQRFVLVGFGAILLTGIMTVFFFFIFLTNLLF
jgi:hypothetical protein